MRFTPPELAHSALEAAPDAMIIIDADGLVRFINRQLFALFGYTREEIVGHSIETLMPERFRGRHVDHRREYMSELRARPMGQNLELYGLRRDGNEFPVEISLSPIDADGEALVVAAIRDISDRQRIQKELLAARAAAEEAREAADRARESADRANQGKSRFLATASHDLRQPLQALALLNGTLRRTVTDPVLSEALAQQDQAIGAMSRLLNTLLDISRLESGAIQPEISHFPVQRIFDEMRREFTSVAERKGLMLGVVPTDVWVRSDRSLVEQLVRNLVSNAVKYTRTGGVTLACSSADESAARIEVRDTGIGIADDQLTLIYDEFYQISAGPDRSRDGYGLGLAIVKRIVQLLELTLDVESQLQQGSTFSLLLPSATADSTVTSPPAEETATGARATHSEPRVLLVEDDTSVRDATRMLLKVEGYQVTPAASLEEALQAIEGGTHFDLLVTDYRLGPNQTGIEVIAALRERLGTPVKSVLVTGDTSAAVRGLAPDPYLRVMSKPIRAESLLRLFKEFLADGERH